MSEGGFTEVTSKGWLSRMGEAIKGIVIGFILFIAAFPLLFWNEGRAVTTYVSTNEGEKNTVSVSPDKVDAENEGKIVHLTGQATTEDKLSDPDFGLTLNALHLRRVAEIYQWVETSDRKTRKKLGGGEETVTEYKYSRDWVKGSVDSGKFKQPTGHENKGTLEFSGRSWTAPKITVGAYKLSPALAGRIANYEAVPTASLELDKASEQVRQGWKPAGDFMYRGAEPGSPQIGDQRIKFEIVKPELVSLYSQQAGDSFRPYQTKAGDALERLELGTHSQQKMFKNAQDENTRLTWILRGVGFFIMALGIYLVFKPLVVIADVLPFLGNLLGIGIGLFAGLIAGALSLVTIAIAWLYYRPIWGGSLMVAGVACIGLLFYLGGKRATAKKG